MLLKSRPFVFSFDGHQKEKTKGQQRKKIYTKRFKDYTLAYTAPCIG